MQTQSYRFECQLQNSIHFYLIIKEKEQELANRLTENRLIFKYNNNPKLTISTIQTTELRTLIETTTDNLAN